MAANDGKTLFGYYGGKNGGIADKIVAMIPPHECYVEPFGGSAGILIRKPPCELEVYNDMDSRLVNLFRVLRDPVSFRKFRRMCYYTPYSREQKAECYRLMNEETADPVTLAWAFFVCARQGFSGNIEATSWGFAISTASYRSLPLSWHDVVSRLGRFHRRFRGVQVDHVDWSVALERYVGPTWLAYCDPPYVHSTRRCDDRYAHEMMDADHERFIAMALANPGMMIVSGYDNEIYRRLDDAGWARTEVNVACYAAAKTEATGLKGVGACDANQRRTEVIWRNNAAVVRLPQGEFGW